MDNNTEELFALLDTFGLLQHVKETTHTQGHTLNTVTSKGLNISSVVIKDLRTLSDHFYVFFDRSLWRFK